MAAGRQLLTIARRARHLSMFRSSLLIVRNTASAGPAAFRALGKDSRRIRHRTGLTTAAVAGMWQAVPGERRLPGALSQLRIRVGRRAES